MSATKAGAGVNMRGGLTVTNVKTACPTCGLVAEGARCPRCNTLKLMSCSGACGSCKAKCG